MDDRPLVTEEMVRQLALLAELPLDSDRLPVVAGQLNALLEEANRVNRFMDSRREVGLALRFRHPDPPEEER